MSKLSLAGRVIMPALRLDKVGAAICREEGLRFIDSVGPCGYLLFGGTLEEAASLTSELKRAAGRPLLFAADLERGGGQQFKGLAKLPPQMAIAACAEAESIAYDAGRSTALDARRAGVNLVFAPLCDVNTEPKNPIINVRSFSDDPRVVSKLAVAWIRGAEENGVLACAKHFPGHGATAGDSHVSLTVGAVDKEIQRRFHTPPFEAACRAGVGSVMTAHMTVPALGETVNPATISPGIVRGILREQFGYDGLVVTDALIMAGINMSEEQAAVLALKAGCDILLYPESPDSVAKRLATMEFSFDAVVAKIEKALDRLEHAPIGGTSETGSVAKRIAAGCVTIVSGAVRRPKSYLVICDETKFSAEPFRKAMAERGIPPMTPGAAGMKSEELIVAIYSRPMAWQDSSRPQESIVKRIPPDCGVVSFGDPYFLFDLAKTSYTIAAYDDHEDIQRAVVAHLVEETAPAGRLPVRRP